MTRHNISGSEADDHRRRDPIVTELPPGRRRKRGLIAAVLTGLALLIGIAAVKAWNHREVVAQASAAGVLTLAVIGIVIGIGGPAHGG